MERLYNPDLMSESEIKATFVAREPLLNTLVKIVADQPEGAGVQHVLLIAPRGMGKTTLLLMLQFAIADRQLDAQWQAVRFPEESYAITDLADFWLETLRHLSVAIEQPQLDQIADELLDKYDDSQDLGEAALAHLRQWSRENGKRILLLVDNFDQIIEQIRNERDEAALRSVLMNEGTFMLVGAAPAHFEEANQYDRALYHFFRSFYLEELEFEQILELLRQRAAADNVPDYEEVLRANKVKLRVLRYFTGGNPRLILMLYRVVSQSQVGEVREGLEKLLDEVTPYYKAKIDSLPAQQRKILDHIARISAQTNEGLTPSEIGKATRISAQAASSQLKRLADLGYVRAANLRGRNSYYALSEPLYAIWHQMRFGRGPQKRVGWLVNFLKQWYSDEEKPLESARLFSVFNDLLNKGEKSKALSNLEHQRYLILAMNEGAGKAKSFDKLLVGYAALDEFELIKSELFAECNLDEVAFSSLMVLHHAGCINEEELSRRLDNNETFTRAVAMISQTFKDTTEANNALTDHDSVKAENIARGVLQNEAPIFFKTDAIEVLGTALHMQRKYEEAQPHLLLASELHPEKVSNLIFLAAGALYTEKLKDAYKYSNDAWKVISATLANEEDETIFLPFYALRMLTCAASEKMDETIEMFVRSSKYKSKAEAESWAFNAMQALQILAIQGHARRVREVIAETETEEIFFPLARALDHLFSGDEALIEKLSPEMRPIVSEIVDKLRPSVEADAPDATATRKPKNPARNRTRKRLK